jgi:hypothetical protein
MCKCIDKHYDVLRDRWIIYYLIYDIYSRLMLKYAFRKWNSMQMSTFNENQNKPCL